MTRKIFAIILALAAVQAAHAQQSTQNVGMHAVPAPGKVVIDGKLDDWDMSGTRLMCYDVSALRDRYSAQAALMYDAEYFYVSLRWKDPTPMVNRYEPVVERGQAWKADCVQLRIRTDRITHVDCWYYTDGEQAGASIHYGMLKKHDPDYEGGIGIDNAMDSGRDWCVHRFADNVSPKARSGAIFFWQGKAAWGQVTLEPEGNLQLPPQTFKEAPVKELTGPIKVDFELPKGAYVTIAIDDAEGRRVRNLVSERGYEPGPHTVRWDGADDDGKLQPAGDYRWKGLYRDAQRLGLYGPGRLHEHNAGMS